MHRGPALGRYVGHPSDRLLAPVAEDLSIADHGPRCGGARLGAAKCDAY